MPRFLYIVRDNFTKHYQFFIIVSTYDIMINYFLTLFVFYTVLKQMDRKFVVIFREHGVKKF
jgi:hypothetical protein